MAKGVLYDESIDEEKIVFPPLIKWEMPRDKFVRFRVGRRLSLQLERRDQTL